MKAKISYFNSRIGYYAATTENRSKVVFSLDDPSLVKLDDILDGDIENRGIRTVFNETRKVQVKLDVKEIHKLDEPFRGHSGKEPGK